MALAHQLTQAGFTVERIHTIAKVHFDQRDGGWVLILSEAAHHYEIMPPAIMK